MHLINGYIEFEELKHLIHNAGLVLFTYQKESVLSSGALMDSIGCSAKVLGPDTGAFRDLAAFDIVATYQSFDEIPQKADKIFE